MNKSRTKIERRENAVLILRGTGFNFFHHFNWMRDYSPTELSQFAAIYALCGGGIAFWSYLNENASFLRTKVDGLSKAFGDFGSNGIIKSVWKVARRTFPFTTNEVIERISPFYGDTLMSQPFSDFPLQNFNFVAFDHTAGNFRIFNKENAAETAVAHIAVAGMLPRNFGPVKMFRPLDHENISSIDFAESSVRGGFFKWLSTKYPNHDFYHFNMSQDKDCGTVKYIKMCNDMFPTTYKIYDAATSFLHLPNGRYRSVYLNSLK